MLEYPIYAQGQNNNNSIINSMLHKQKKFWGCCVTLIANKYTLL